MSRVIAPWIRLTRSAAAPGNMYVCEDAERHQLMILSQKVKNIQDALDALGWDAPAASSLFDAASYKQRKGKTGAWAVHKLSSEDLPRFVAERRRHFARTVIAATDPSAWQLTRGVKLSCHLEKALRVDGPVRSGAIPGERGGKDKGVKVSTAVLPRVSNGTRGRVPPD
jgi:hypothetical protein